MTTQHPLAFHAIQLRELTLADRIVISPMCQRAPEGGHTTTWHLVYALGGAGLIPTERIAVDSRERIGAVDLSLWKDSQTGLPKEIVDFVHANGGAIGVQLAHAGRKAGSEPLREGGAALSEARPVSGDGTKAKARPQRTAGGAGVVCACDVGPRRHRERHSGPKGRACLRNVFRALHEPVPRLRQPY